MISRRGWNDGSDEPRGAIAAPTVFQTAIPSDELKQIHGRAALRQLADVSHAEWISAHAAHT
jgi:hypothetical protein